MSKFKVGDRVKDVSGHLKKFAPEAKGTGTVVSFKPGGDYKVAWDGEDWHRDNWGDDQLEKLQIQSPVRTKTVTEIVEGVYGRLSIKQQGGDEPRLLVALANLGGRVDMVHHGWSLGEVDDAISTLTDIRDALQEQDK